jgi:hypothetical protein
MKPLRLALLLLALAGPAAAAPLPMGRPYYLQIRAETLGAAKDAHGGSRHPAECQIDFGPPPGAADPVFLETGCRPSRHPYLTRWDPQRQRMISGADVTARPAFVPPAALLDLHAWAPAEAFADGPNRPATGDYEVELKTPTPGPQRSRITRRSGGWVRNVDADWDGRQSLTVQNLDVGVSLLTWHDAQSTTVAIRGPSPLRPFVPPTGPVRLTKQPDQTVLGETCSWWDLEPGTYDAGLWECRAVDAVPLIVRRFGKGSLGDDIVAVAVHRGRVPLSRVLPSKAEVSAKLLGLAN